LEYFCGLYCPKVKKSNYVLQQLRESDLIELIRSGNTAAFKELVQRFEGPVSNVVIGLLGRTPEAENIAQDVFIKFFYSIDQFREESGIKTYLTRIAINLSLNELKKLSRERKRLAFDVENRPETADAGMSGAERLELKEAIDLALSKLEPRQRAVVVLRLIEGYSTRETAKILKIPDGTVLSRLHRAQEELRILLKKYL
jgi:RNA polymerase sigma-70 factor (ECF subfamily)